MRARAAMKQQERAVWRAFCSLVRARPIRDAIVLPLTLHMIVKGSAGREKEALVT